MNRTAMNGSNHILKTERQTGFIFPQIRHTLFQVVKFLMIFQVLQMRNYGIFTLADHSLQYLLFIISLGLPLFNSNGILRTMSDTGAQTIAHQITYKPGFPIYNLEGSFMTTRYT